MLARHRHLLAPPLREHQAPPRVVLSLGWASSVVTSSAIRSCPLAFALLDFLFFCSSRFHPRHEVENAVHHVHWDLASVNFVDDDTAPLVEQDAMPILRGCGHRKQDLVHRCHSTRECAHEVFLSDTRWLSLLYTSFTAGGLETARAGDLVPVVALGLYSTTLAATHSMQLPRSSPHFLRRLPTVSVSVAIQCCRG